MDSVETVTAIIGHYTVGLIDVRDKSMPRLIGSGTLVNFGEVEGVLTCAHVRRHVTASTEFGIVCFPVGKSQLQAHKIIVGVTECVEFSNDLNAADGPDIAFIRIPSEKLGAIRAVASVVNGDLHQKRWFEGEPHTKRVSEFVSGVVGEWTSESQLMGPRTRKTTFNGTTRSGEVITVRKSGLFDLFEFQPDTGGDLIVPKSYGGMSGAGLWRVYLNEDDTDCEYRLVGVAFFETANGTIICHGIRSVYNALYDKVRDAWL